MITQLLITPLRFITLKQKCVFVFVLRKARIGFRYHMICTRRCVRIVHAVVAAAAELVVWGHEVYPALQTQPGPPHRESYVVSLYYVPPAKKGPPKSRRPFTTNVLRVSYGHECSSRTRRFCYLSYVLLLYDVDHIYLSLIHI